jgi:tripartite-type tricarboxylate transporter receptor subunit TctC
MYIFIKIFIFILSLTFFNLSIAQSYPNKPIRLIIPYPPGSSSNDILGRGLAKRLSEALGVQIVVDNRAGAGGNIGSEMAAKSPPDGYTLLMGINGPLAIGPSLYTHLNYDPIKDLIPIAMFATVPFVIVVNPTVPANNINEFIELAKNRSGQINFAASGNGTTTHLCAELFKLSTGINTVHVPYKGGAPAVIDLISGNVHIFCTGLTAVISQIKFGKLRALGLASLSRSPLIPTLQTVSEQGVKGFEVNSWSGLLAPARTPNFIIQKLYNEVAKIVSDPEMKKFILDQGAEPIIMNPQQFSLHLKAETYKWAKLVKNANIRLN